MGSLPITSSVAPTLDTTLFATTLDTIIYLASLASNIRIIEPLMDPVRAITSRANATQADLEVLQQTRQQLEDYLIHNDPARVFEHEELQQKIKEHSSAWRFNKLRRYLYGVIFAMFATFAIAFIIPGAGDSTERSQLGSSLSLLALSAGAAWFFLTARKKFKLELRPAYTLLCASSVVLGLSQIQLPIVAYWNLGSSPLFRYGGLSTPTFIAIICVYLALRRYAKTIGLPASPFTSLRVVGSASISLILVAIFIPHSSHPQNEALFDFSVAIMSTNLLVIIINAIIARQIAGITAKIYAKAMNFLMASQISAGVGLVLFLVFLFFKGALFGADLAILAIPFVISNVVWLMASYAFKRATEY